MRTLEEDGLLYLEILPNDARLVHDHVVFHHPTEKDALVNRGKKDIFVHLAEKFVQLLLVLLKLMPLLRQQVLNSLSINRPVNKGHFRNSSLHLCVVHFPEQGFVLGFVKFEVNVVWAGFGEYFGVGGKVLDKLLVEVREAASRLLEGGGILLVFNLGLRKSLIVKGLQVVGPCRQALADDRVINHRARDIAALDLELVCDRLLSLLGPLGQVKCILFLHILVHEHLKLVDDILVSVYWVDLASRAVRG